MGHFFTNEPYHFDGLGSTRALTDSSQQVTDTNLYDAWGVGRDSSGTTVNPWRWVGQSGYYTDAETGRVSVRERPFEPVIAIWIRLDPAGFGDGVHRYKYTHNRPVLQIDPSGLWLQALTNAWYAEPGDTFESAVALADPALTKKSKSCIQPICNVAATDWEKGNITVGGLYDVSNLTNSLPPSDPIRASIGRDCTGYIELGNIFFGVAEDWKHMTGIGFATKVMKQARDSGPVGEVWMIGHSWLRIKAIGGTNAGCGFEVQRRFVPGPGVIVVRVPITSPGTDQVFVLEHLGEAAQLRNKRDMWEWQADLKRATAGELPPGCWFRSDASVRLIGCRTTVFANELGAFLIRKNATAFGTKQPTWAKPRPAPQQPLFGWGQGAGNNWRPVGNVWASSPTEYFEEEPHKQKWAEVSGKN